MCSLTVSDLRISDDVVHTAITTCLSSKNNVTPDVIPSVFLKETASSISHVFGIIFNHPLCLGSLPLDWKNTFVVPVLENTQKLELVIIAQLVSPPLSVKS